MAVVNYESTHGCLPPAYIPDQQGRPMHSWRVLLLPFLNRNDLYDQYNLLEPWNSPNNLKLASQMPSIYKFSYYNDIETTTTNYLVVVGPETLWPGSTSAKRADTIDGTANTVLIVENEGMNVHWMEPRDLDFRTMNFNLNQPQGINSWAVDPAIVTADGSVLRLKKLEPPMVRSLLTKAGGEPVSRNDNGQWEEIPDGRLRDPKPKPESATEPTQDEK